VGESVYFVELIGLVLMVGDEDAAIRNDWYFVSLDIVKIKRSLWSSPMIADDAVGVHNNVDVPIRKTKKKLFQIKLFLFEIIIMVLGS
jgi:hypothetical protein